MRKFQLFIKRAFDLIVSVIALIFMIVIPVMIVIPILIKLTSKGPAVFTQDRVGKDGKIFKIYKFRTMRIPEESFAPDGRQLEPKERITKVGRFLRKTSLDEFPQFINILMGDMSLVGTRPPTLDEFVQYSPYHKKRLSFRPGLTGMWQVSGRSDITDFEEIVRLDVEYIDDWSIILDIKILLKTVMAVFAKDGAR